MNLILFHILKKGKTWCISVGLCLCVVSLQGQSLAFKHLTVANGLSQNSVLTIQQDSLGYLWFGTENGLNRYNGYEFEIFEFSNQDSLSLPSNVINTLEIDRNNQMWIGTDKGLCLYDQQYARFTRMDKYFGNDKLLGQYDFWDIIVDSEHTVWLLGEANGFHLFRKKKDETVFNKLLELPERPGNTVGLYGQLMEDNSGNIWVATSKNGLWLYHKKENKFSQRFVSSNPEEAITALLQDGHGTIWAGTLKGGLYQSSDNKNFQRVAGLNDSDIRSLYFDRQGRFWVGTDKGGLNLYNFKTKTFTYFDHDISDQSTLLHNSVWSIFQDKQNILWVGTYAGGVSYYNPNINNFKLFQAGTTQYNLSNNTVTGFTEDKKGNIWIATDRGGLNFFNRENETFKSYRNNKHDINSISSNIILHVTETSQNELWIATWLGGLNYFNKTTQQFTRYYHDPKDSKSISSNTVNYVFEDHHKNLWLGTSMGIDYIDHNQLGKGEAPRLSPKHFLHNKSDISSISDNYIRTFHQDSEGRIWIGTWSGLNMFDPATQTFHNYRNNPAQKKIFTKDLILSVAQNKEGNFLIGTFQNGLLYYDNKTDSLVMYNKRNGFPSNSVFGMVQDDHGFWWISTINGLIKFWEKDGSFILYNQHDGLQSSEFKSNAYYRLSTGEFLFGGTNGFNIFHPDSIVKNLTPPSVVFSKFKLFNKTITPTEGSPLIKDVAFTNTIELTHDQSFIGIEFTGLNFTVPEKNQYAYTLKGVDKEWNYVSRERAASYSYLSPGKYTFYVKAANNDGVWGEPKALNIIIHAPWWQTSWFILFSWVMLISLLWTAYKLRTRQLHHRKKILEQTVLERTAELQQKNNLLSERQEEILHQKEEIKTQRDNLEQQYHTIQTLSDIGQKITASIKKDELVARVYDMINRIIDAPHFSIGYLNKQKNAVEFSTITNYGNSIKEDIISIEHADRLSIHCIKTEQVILLNNIDTEIDKYLPGTTRYKKEDAANAAIYIPLFSMDEEVSGVLIVKNYKTDCYSSIHLSMLKNLAAYIGIAFDNATVYKEIEAQSKILTLQSSRLKELDILKTRFFMNISHEFRTPLTLILSPLEQILSNTDTLDLSVGRRQLEIMNKNAKQLLHLINELLDLRNIEAGIFKLTASQHDLVAFMQEVILPFEDLAARHQISFAFETASEEILISSDIKMMEKIFNNIYSNAFKYTMAGGTIKTTVRLTEILTEDFAEITITDTGVGIPADELQHIFERFYQGAEPVNRLQKSTGIGLSFVKDLVEMHGGKITVNSVLNEGTTFTLHFPIKHQSKDSVVVLDDAVDVTSPTKAKDEENESKSLQNSEDSLDKSLPIILLVDDNADIREFLKTTLEKEYSIVEADDGQKGVSLALQIVPDLIISDIMMPVMDGIQLCMQLKTDHRTSHVPVILLTAKTGEESQLQGLNIGADDYIPKPFNIKILHARVQNLLISRKKLHAIFSSKVPVEINEIVTNVQDKSFLEKVENVMKQNVKDPALNHEILAKEVGMSKTQLYRKLQALTGKTVHEYIRNYRLKLAYELLKEKPGMMIFEVAYELGFKDHSYFSKSFHSFFGLWPKDLRKNNVV